MQVFEVAPAPRVVVVARAEDGAVEAQHGRELRARRLNLHQPEQQPRELRQLLLVNRTRREAVQLPEERLLRLRRAKLPALDAEVFEYLVDGRVADAVEHLQRAEPRERVRGVRDDAQEGERVLDVRGLGELDAAVLAERDALPRQLDLKVEGVRAGAEEDGYLRERHARVPQLSDALGDEARLLVLVAGVDENGRLARVVHAREELLAVALLGLRNDRVRHVEDGLRAAEVLLQ